MPSLSHYVKKGSCVSMMVGHGSGTYSSQQQVLVLHSVSITNIMPFIIDVGDHWLSSS